MAGILPFLHPKLRNLVAVVATLLILIILSFVALNQGRDFFENRPDTKAAKVANCHFGNNYYFGNNMPQDYTQTVKLMEKASQQVGDAEDQFNLGTMYYKGDGGLKKDYEKAMEWWQKAADQGYAQAQFNLGVIYASDEWVTQDYKKAMEWWQKAADQGDAEAQYNLGVIYACGKWVEQDDEKAVEWYEKAAQQGHAKAQNSLGWMYYKGGE